MSERHCGLERGVLRSVAAAGASRTYRRAYPAANDLVGIYEDVGTRLNGASSVHSFRFSTSVSDGPAMSAIRSSVGDYPFERNVFPSVSST
jgi:hypothetical protein